jgi:hypothetical protein
LGKNTLASPQNPKPHDDSGGGDHLDDTTITREVGGKYVKEALFGL